MRFNITPEQFNKSIVSDPAFKCFGYLDSRSGIAFKKKDNVFICSYWIINPLFSKQVETSFDFSLIPKDWSGFKAFSTQVKEYFRRYSENACFLIDLY